MKAAPDAAGIAAGRALRLRRPWGRRLPHAWPSLAGTLLAAALLLPLPVRAEPVAFTNAEGTLIAAHWLPAAAAAGEARPAVVALHGCGGLYRRDGTTLENRYTDYTARLHAAGIHVLLPDSFGSRGSGPICTVLAGERTIGAETRRADVLAALRWLRLQPDVDARRIVLLGWSHGATTLLSALNAKRAGHAEVAGAIAFYPGCRAARRQPFAAAAPLLMLLGADDDWTPPAPCEELVARVREQQPQADLVLIVYPDSVHGFDSRQPVRLRTDVPNGVDPAGVHLGGNPKARAAALAEMDRFLARILQSDGPVSGENAATARRSAPEASPSGAREKVVQ
jgi:dienelactone hydrolase